MAVAPKSRSDLALLLLVICAMRHYGWDFFPAELKGLASKGLGGIALLAMVVIVAAQNRDLCVKLVAAWWAFEELQVVLCSFAYMAAPWPVEPGQALCSARLDIDMGAIGIVAIAWIAGFAYRNRHG